MNRVFLSLMPLLATAGFAPAQSTLTVASLSTITTEIAQKVGGDTVAVTGLVRPGVDPHEYEPTPEDLKKIAGAQLVLATGKGMEGYLSKLARASARSRLIKIGDSFPSLEMEEDGKKIEDPHWWHSIANMKKAVAVVKDAFIQAAPAQKGFFEKNAAAYLASLEALDQWTKTKIATLPRDKRRLVTSHDAFQYFARDFGFSIYPIEGVSTEDEPSSGKVAGLIKVIKAEKVKAIFFENIENPKVIQEITRETGAVVGGELYADGLGEGDAGTYAGMVKHNVSTIVDALK